MDKWMMEMDRRGLYNGKNLHKKGIAKIYKKKINQDSL